MVDFAWWRRCDAEVQAEVVSAKAIAWMRAQPGFNAAVRNSLGGGFSHNDHHPAFKRLAVDMGSLMLGVIALHLDATGGLTHRRLRSLAGNSGIVSAGRASALLMRMQMIGWVSAARDLPPGVPKLYRPTPQMIAAFQAKYRLELESIQLMAPDAGELLAWYDQPEGFRAFMAEYGVLVLRDLARPRPPVNSLLEIAGRRAGVLVLSALGIAAAEAADGSPAPAPVRISLAGLSRRFGVSRTQVAAILRDAAAAGYIRRLEAEGEAEVLPALVEAGAQVYAEGCISVAACAYRALRDRAVTEAA
ncbi:MAG: hypothetical protein ABI655_11550 [Phenylobacterium sp.]